eukprot:scaffold22893_cov27-Tisochrysis_lutea.AAC.4
MRLKLGDVEGERLLVRHPHSLPACEKELQSWSPPQQGRQQVNEARRCSSVLREQIAAVDEEQGGALHKGAQNLLSYLEVGSGRDVWQTERSCNAVAQLVHRAKPACVNREDAILKGVTNAEVVRDCDG